LALSSSPSQIAFLDAVPHLVKRILSLGPLRQIGVWSYSLYLWQQPFYKLKETIPLQWLVPAVAVSALLSFYVVERPMRQYLNARISPTAMPVPKPAEQPIA
jgi:peptidoglycan/LPS O-acetylase OafA/YrhL